MPKENVTARVDRAIARIAAGRYGIVTFAQLIEVGAHSSGITDRVAARRLHRLHRGVYSVVATLRSLLG